MSLVFSMRPPPILEASGIDDGIFMRGTNGRAVILIHGLTGTPNEMRFLAWFLHSHGYTVSCPRLAKPGKALSVVQATPWRKFYSSVSGPDRSLRPDHAQVFACGLSMGALLALLLADEHGELIEGVSFLSPTLFYDGWNVPWYHVLLRLAPWTGIEDRLYFREEPPYGLKNERIRGRVHEFFSSADLHDMSAVDRYGYPFFPVRLLSELRRLVRHLRSRLGGVRCPCQIIQARHDDMSSVRNALFIYERVASAAKEIVYLEDSYHVITADQERGKVANAMLDFFARIPAHA